MQEEEEEFDMFAPVCANSKSMPKSGDDAKPTHTDTIVVMRRAEDFSDSQGYLRAPVGTLLKTNGEEAYQILGKLGEGVFSTVFLVKEMREKEAESGLFAAKVLRANETMYKAGRKEIEVLRALGPHPHIVHLVKWFELNPKHEGTAATEQHGPPHLVLIFERMEMNLREALDKFGRNVGLAMSACKTYAKQLLAVLARFKQLNLVHADLKPDNIMVSQDLRRCAVADFGSAFYLTDAEALQPMPYLISRYYRSPEVILGLPATPASDVWSLGVLLYELFAGTVLFPGQTNNDMLDKMQQTLGRFPKQMIKRHCLVYETKLEVEPHFDAQTLQFKSHELDAATGKTIRRMITVPEQPSKSLLALLTRKAAAAEEEMDEDFLAFSRLLSRCLTLDPERRLDPTAACVDDLFAPRNAKRARQA